LDDGNSISMERTVKGLQGQQGVADGIQWQTTHRQQSQQQSKKQSTAVMELLATIASSVAQTLKYLVQPAEKVASDRSSSSGITKSTSVNHKLF